MVMEAYHRLTLPVTWLKRMELAWQSSVTTVKTEHWWTDATHRDVTHVTFTTRERVCLSWRVSPESPHTVNSLSSMSAIIQGYSEINSLGGCHVIILRLRTGAEHHLAVVSAHAGWQAHVQTPNMVVTVTRMTMYGVKTAVSSLTEPIFQLYSSSLET